MKMKKKNMYIEKKTNTKKLNEYKEKNQNPSHTIIL